ncbi:hypothetical protein FQN57_001514 [Myotisia sp. PD_48]|nr:hypothetical protein FQN57_001514 [Myotisia sp. PD_48]
MESLPSAEIQSLAPYVTLQPPLSRRGKGPPLFLLVPDNPDELGPHVQTLDPPPLQKWAEEGYAVVEIILSVAEANSEKPTILARIRSRVEVAVNRLLDLSACNPTDSVGLIVYDASLLTGHVLAALQYIPNIVAMITYGCVDEPVHADKDYHLVHLPGDFSEAHLKSKFNDNVTIHKYPEVTSPSFVLPKHQDYVPSVAAVAHSRSLAFLKRKMGGPIFDLEAIWEEHTHFEFGDRSVEKTMGTMVQEPYVNHIPTMTGGIGRARLQNFYRYHFIWNNPEDSKLELISRTVGVDRVIDEFIFCFAHTKTIDWLAPGIPPTGKDVRLPMVSVVNVRGDRLHHEHIWWDQANLLVQLGLMPEYLPFPYPLENGQTPAPGKIFEYRVPAAGIKAAKKFANEHSVESNEMLEYTIREVDAE